MGQPNGRLARQGKARRDAGSSKGIALASLHTCDVFEYRRYGRTVALQVGSEFSESTTFHATQFDTRHTDPSVVRNPSDDSGRC